MLRPARYAPTPGRSPRARQLVERERRQLVSVGSFQQREQPRLLIGLLPNGSAVHAFATTSIAFVAKLAAKGHDKQEESAHPRRGETRRGGRRIV